MDPNSITTMIDKLGFPIAMAVVMLGFNYMLMRWVMRVTEEQKKDHHDNAAQVAVHAENLAKLNRESYNVISQNSIAMKDNTIAIKELSSKIVTCRADELLRPKGA